MTHRCLRAALLCAALWLTTASPGLAQDALVQIYVVRHPETESAPADRRAIHLSEPGRQSAALLVPTLAGVNISHLCASHTLRAREVLEPLALERSVPIVQLPVPGSTLDGHVVTDEIPVARPSGRLHERC